MLKHISEGTARCLGSLFRVVEPHPVGFTSNVEAGKCLTCARQVIDMIESVGVENFSIVNANFHLLNF